MGFFPLRKGGLILLSFLYDTIGSLFIGHVGRDLVYELRRRLRPLCYALMYRQYLCQSITPANPLLHDNVFMSVDDITWLLNSVRSL